MKQMELKPCPFCGDTHIHVYKGEKEPFTGFRYVVGCNTVNCVALHTRGKPFGTEQEAIEAWNRRVEYGCLKKIKELPSVQPEQRWIPVKYRPMDSEEREYWEDQFGEKLEDEDAVMFDCPMPEDGQEILVTYQKWIFIDKCEIDGGLYGLEGFGDWEDVIAWMPLPKIYSGE